ncbi:MAG: hypothetical protein NTW90_07080 [Nitrosospira sp.]|nr:hypothetical protein [Nitrosospira sp.]
MHKISIAIILMSCTFLAQAQESDAVFLGTSSDVSVYVYPNTVKIISTGLVQAWSLYDMSSRQFVNNVYLHSVKSLNVVDCRNQRIGILNDIYYAKRGGKGEVVWNGAVEMSAIKWQYIAPKSMSELKFDFICDLVKAKRGGA